MNDKEILAVLAVGLFCGCLALCHWVVLKITKGDVQK